MPRASQKNQSQGERDMPRGSKSKAKPAQNYEIEITLRGIKPRIWRRFAVPSTISVLKLHDVIQIVMGWYDCHLHQFITPDGLRIAPRSDDMDPEWDADVRESRRIRLSGVMNGVGSMLRYEYDFGDGWVHDLRCVAMRPATSGEARPHCLAGARACPPEDVGGVWGYAEFLAALADPAHEEHASYREWIGRPFDPESFSVETVNEVLRRFR